MDEEPYRTRSVVAKRARLSVDASATTEEATEERRGTRAPQPSWSPTTFRPRPRIPPDASRYVALWNKGVATAANDGDPNNLDTTAVSSDAALPPLSTILDELDLAEHNQEIWDRIEALQRTIDECEREIDELRNELDVRTACLPRLLGRDRPNHRHRRYWDEVLPSRMKHDKAWAWAWALVRAAQQQRQQWQQQHQQQEEEEVEDPRSRGLVGSDRAVAYENNGYDNGSGTSYGRTSLLPLPFQEMLWSKQRCPLRADRSLLLASLDGGLDPSVRIVWTKHIAYDREILIKIFETCPWGLDGVRIPARILKDKDLIRAFAQSASLRQYRETLTWSDDQPVCRFSLDVDEDPTLLIELVCQVVETEQKDKWACGMVRQHLRVSEQTTDDNYMRLVLGVAEKTTSVPWKEYCQHCPIRYHNLPPHLQGSREVVLAFIPVDASVTSLVPLSLHDDVDLWQAAVHRTPRYASIRVPVPSPDSQSKLYYLLLLEDSAYPLVETPYFTNLPDSAGNDRDFAVRYTCLRSQKNYGTWSKQIIAAFGHDRDFWMELAEAHHCHAKAWLWISDPIKADPAVVRAWARNATDVDCCWLASKASELPALLSDRQVLINCLPPIWSQRRGGCHSEHRRKIWRHIDRTVLDYNLWLELVSRCELDRFKRLLPSDIRNEPAIVRARLRSTMADADSFTGLFNDILSLGLRLQHLDVLLEMIQGMNSKVFFSSHLYDSLDMSVLHAPQVALALLSKGWRSCHDRFGEAVESAPWSTDPDFLMQAAERKLIPAFRGCCPDILLKDKSLALQILRIDSRLWSVMEDVHYADDDGVFKCLRYDFDVLLCALGSASSDAILSGIPPLDAYSRRNYCKCASPTEKFVSFARDVRRRLTLYASIETIVMGTTTSLTTDRATATTTTSPLSLLDQDRYTKSNFRNRLVELLGAPSGDDDVATLRRVSNALSRHGF